MNPERLRALLERVANGAATPLQAASELETLPFEDIGIARLDHHRGLRQVVPEVVFGGTKEPRDVVRIAQTVLERTGRVLVTRATPPMAEALVASVPDIVWHERARCLELIREATPTVGKVVIVAAGTSDLPVAEEARVCATHFGCEVELIVDVGVAGVHRLLAVHDAVSKAEVVIAIAGMEGALASVVGGLARGPVIAVPTSVGYGAHFGGIATLLAMLNSCAAGVTVVNIDNGFGAAAAARRILELKK